MTITASPPAQIGQCTRREALRWLARDCDGTPWVLATAAVGLASPALAQHHLECCCGHCAAYHWAALLTDYALLDDLESYCGEIGEEYARSADPWGDAIADVRMRIEATLDVLADGERGA